MYTRAFDLEFPNLDCVIMGCWFCVGKGGKQILIPDIGIHGGVVEFIGELWCVLLKSIEVEEWDEVVKSNVWFVGKRDCKGVGFGLLSGECGGGVEFVWI